MVIENVSGAGGTIGSARVAAAPSDGCTLLAGSMGSHVAAPVLAASLKYDPLRDFRPIGFTAQSPAVIVARKDFPANNLRQFVDYLKQNGERVKQAHGGIGASSLDKSLDDPGLKAKVADLGGSIPSKSERTPAQFSGFVNGEIARWASVLNVLGRPELERIERQLDQASPAARNLRSLSASKSV
jgi:tripartite-type tricarboxylate transporter receptor subunit TctC